MMEWQAMWIVAEPWGFDLEVIELEGL